MTIGLYLKIGRVLPLNLRMFYCLHLSREAAKKYVPTIYLGHITLIQMASKSEKKESELIRLAAGGVDLHKVPGAHLDIIRGPQVAIIAQRLKESLLEQQHAH